MTKTKYDFPSIGCYVDESSGSADDLNQRTIDFAVDYGFEFDETELPVVDEDNEHADGERSQALSEYADNAVDFLNEQENRTGLCWQFEDNSLFLSVDIEGVKEDVGFVSGGEDCDPEDSAYPAPDYLGEWLHVNERGNCTLYNRKETGMGIQNFEIWACV